MVYTGRMPLHQPQTVSKGNVRELAHIARNADFLQGGDLPEVAKASDVLRAHLFGEIENIKGQLLDLGLAAYVPTISELYEQANAAVSPEEQELDDRIQKLADDMPEEEAWSEEELDDVFEIMWAMKVNAHVLTTLVEHPLVRRTVFKQMPLLKSKIVTITKKEPSTEDDTLEAL